MSCPSLEDPPFRVTVVALCAEAALAGVAPDSFPEKLFLLGEDGESNFMKCRFFLSLLLPLISRQKNF